MTLQALSKDSNTPSDGKLAALSHSSLEQRVLLVVMQRLGLSQGQCAGAGQALASPGLLHSMHALLPVTKKPGFEAEFWCVWRGARMFCRVKEG